jgi:predicted dehydrogenase
MSDPLKCGIVGYGYMGEIRRRVVEERDDLVLVGVAEPDPARRARVRGCEAFADADELLARDIDLVFVATPNHVAPAYAVRSLEAGRHVFCEKPPGRSLADIRAIRDAEARRGGKLMFGFNHRYHPAVLKAKAIVESGRLGGVVNLRGLYGKSGGRNYPASWRNDPAVSGGGILLDQGIHMLDLFRFFAGDFDEVKCFASNAFWKTPVEDNAYVIMRGAGGVHAILHSSATLWRHTFRCDITLEGGYLSIEGLLSKSGSYGRERLTVARREFEDEAAAVGNPAEEVTYFDRDLSWEMEVDAFVRAVREDAPVTVSGSEDALRVMEIVARAYADAGIADGVPAEAEAAS